MQRRCGGWSRARRCTELGLLGFNFLSGFRIALQNSGVSCTLTSRALTSFVACSCVQKGPCFFVCHWENNYVVLPLWCFLLNWHGKVIPFFNVLFLCSYAVWRGHYYMCLFSLHVWLCEMGDFCAKRIPRQTGEWPDCAFVFKMWLVLLPLKSKFL